MMIAEEQDQLEKERAEHFIHETPTMEGVESVRVELGEDHSGDPAMWLVFRLNKEVEFDKEYINKFIDYSGNIQMKILHGGLKRFPYTRLERAA